MNIKKTSLLIIYYATYLISIQLYAHDFEEIKTSQTFLYYRPVYFNIAAKHSLWSQMFYEKSQSCKGVFQFLPIYQESRDNLHLAKYFLINCKEKIIIAGDNSIYQNSRDVRAEWFNLPNDFASYLSLNPCQKQTAFIFNFNQDLKNWTNIEYFRNFWLDLSIPVTQVKNNINPIASIINNSGTNQELILALQNVPINAKFTPQNLENTEIAQIKLTLGTRWFTQNNFFLAMYGSLIAPGSDHPGPRYLFNSIVGPNGHWGMATGLRLELPLFSCPENYIDTYCFNNNQNIGFKTWLFLDIENQNFFRAKRCRVFDLKHKQWSRYLKFKRQNQENSITGTQILTLDSWVNPHNMVDITTGIMFRFNQIEAQIGYSLWARQQETIRLVRPACLETGFAFEQFGIAGPIPGTSASNSTIKNLALIDPEFTFLKEEDIDLCSGSYPGGSSNKIYLFMGLNTLVNNNFIFSGIGSFYEWAHTNNAITNWGVWAKFGTSF